LFPDKIENNKIALNTNNNNDNICMIKTPFFEGFYNSNIDPKFPDQKIINDSVEKQIKNLTDLVTKLYESTSLF
jgi:hypothetical protein